MDDTTVATLAGDHRRLSMVTIFLASMAFLLVATSVAAFIYVTRKENVLRKLHLIAVVIIILVELAFFVAVIICCATHSKSSVAQVLAATLIILSLLALMALIYFLLEDILKDKVEPYPGNLSPFKSYEIQEVKSISSHLTDAQAPADEMAIPIDTPFTLTPFPRLPTPPELTRPSSMGNSVPISPSQDKMFLFEQEISRVVDLDKVRQDLLVATEGRLIPALEEAIQQVKDQNYQQELKHEYERALELLNRLIRIEHMKMRVLRLNQAIIAELHSYTKPPEEVSTMMRATLLLLGHSDKEIQEWSQMQNLLGRLGKESIRRRCYELNPLTIPVDKAREAKNILRNYDLLRVSEISVGLAAFFSWAMTMIEEREKLLDSQGTIKQ